MRNNPPDVIYLQYSSEDAGDSDDFPETTWCEDQIYDTDIKYIRDKSGEMNLKYHLHVGGEHNPDFCVPCLREEVACLRIENGRLKEILAVLERAGVYNPSFGGTVKIDDNA